MIHIKLIKFTFLLIVICFIISMIFVALSVAKSEQLKEKKEYEKTYFAPMVNALKY